MFWEKETGKAYFMIHHLVPSSRDTEYQLWALVDGKPMGLGAINDSIRDRFIPLDGVPAEATAFIVTLEKAGKTASPTFDQTYLRGEI